MHEVILWLNFSRVVVFIGCRDYTDLGENGTDTSVLSVVAQIWLTIWVQLRGPAQRSLWKLYRLGLM